MCWCLRFGMSSKAVWTNPRQNRCTHEPLQNWWLELMIHFPFWVGPWSIYYFFLVFVDVWFEFIGFIMFHHFMNILPVDSRAFVVGCFVHFLGCETWRCPGSSTGSLQLVARWPCWWKVFPARRIPTNVTSSLELGEWHGAIRWF